MEQNEFKILEIKELENESYKNAAISMGFLILGTLIILFQEKIYYNTYLRCFKELNNLVDEKKISLSFAKILNLQLALSNINLKEAALKIFGAGVFFNYKLIRNLDNAITLKKKI